jgi:hypothetical protein
VKRRQGDPSSLLVTNQGGLTKLGCDAGQESASPARGVFRNVFTMTSIFYKTGASFPPDAAGRVA